MLDPNSNIGHFKIIRKLGEGGMGEVYLAEDEKLGRKVAIKILQKEFFDNPERLSRFNREAKTAAKINHPNIMSIYDIGEMSVKDNDSDMSYIVMEYIEGDSLGNYMATKSPKITDKLRVGSKIAAGLAAAHKLGIVHRDIKMDNIMLNDDGEVKILDFGLAKPIESALSYGTDTNDDDTNTVSEELTKEGKIVGTITYMSPEQARGDTVDNRADIFSFGILLYKMFVGDFPFKGSDNVSTIAKILEARHEPIRVKDETLPAELERIIDKCLQKNPNERYQDTRDLAIDLKNLRRQFDSGLTDSISGISSISETPKVTKTFKFSGKKLIAGIGLFILIIVVAAIVVDSFTSKADLVLNDKDKYGIELATKILKDVGLDGGINKYLPEHMKKKDALAIFSFENKTGDESLNWLESGLPEILMTDLTQSGASNIISRQRIFDQVESKTGENVSHQDYLDAAESLGASKALSGSFYKMGNKIRIDARLEDIKSGQILLGEKVVGEEPFALVDSLTIKIAQSLNIKDSLAKSQNVASLTTEFPEAYKEYTLGMENLETNTFDSAVAHFEKAVEIDTAFALAYMRLGMTYGFRNRGQQGLPYFIGAEKYKDKLSVKDRSLLNIFMDIWQHRNFDNAFAQLKTFVENYPDDKEARTFYSLFIMLFAQDEKSALAQIDTVLMIDPHYHLALSALCDLYSKKDNYDKAIEYAEKIKQYYPKSASGYSLLMNFYFSLSKFDESEREAKLLMELYPNHRGALSRLARISVVKRDFDKAKSYREKEWQDKNDHYQTITYHNAMSNLDIWQGKFKSCFENAHLVLQAAHRLKDSVRISGQYNSIASTYQFFNMPDSAIKYGKLGYQWASQFSDFEYPTLLITIDPSNDTEARPLFEKAMTNFKSKVPEGMWPLADLVKEQYDAAVSSDTLRHIEALKSLLNDFGQNYAATIEELGRYQIFVGLYDEGISTLKRLLSGEEETLSGLYYIRALYNIGWAYYELGNTDEAKKHFEEVLLYWGDADIEIKEVLNSRKYLSELQS